MKTLTIEDRRRILLEILDYIDQICKECGFTYYLAYGSLLGAVRHKGFIPWDDDIDLWIPMRCYDELLEEITKRKRYRVINHFDDPDWTDPFSKVSDKKTLVQVNNYTLEWDPDSVTRSGVSIDLFPLMDVDEFSYRILYDYIHKRGRFFRYKRGIQKGIKKMYCFIFDKLGRGESFWRNKRNNYMRAKRNTKYIGCPVSPYGRKELFSREMFEEIKLYFEGKEYSAPKGYHDILSLIYGDYMTPPPESQRKTFTHDETTYLIDD